jgi:hypothetical protein
MPGAFSTHGEAVYPYKLMMWKPREKRTRRRPRDRRKNTKININEVKWEDVDWLHMACGRDKQLTEYIYIYVYIYTHIYMYVCVCLEMRTGKCLWTEYYALRRRQMAVEWLHMAWDRDKGLYVAARYESFDWHKIRGISSLTEEINVGIFSMKLGN